MSLRARALEALDRLLDRINEHMGRGEACEQLCLTFEAGCDAVLDGDPGYGLALAQGALLRGEPGTR